MIRTPNWSKFKSVSKIGHPQVGCVGCTGWTALGLFFSRFLQTWVFPEMVVPPKHPKIVIFSRNTNSCWVPPFWETHRRSIGSFFFFLVGFVTYFMTLHWHKFLLLVGNARYKVSVWSLLLFVRFFWCIVKLVVLIFPEIHEITAQTWFPAWFGICWKQQFPRFQPLNSFPRRILVPVCLDPAARSVHWWTSPSWRLGISLMRRLEFMSLRRKKKGRWFRNILRKLTWRTPLLSGWCGLEDSTVHKIRGTCEIRLLYINYCFFLHVELMYH